MTIRARPTVVPFRAGVTAPLPQSAPAPPAEHAGEVPRSEAEMGPGKPVTIGLPNLSVREMAAQLAPLWPRS